MTNAQSQANDDEAKVGTYQLPDPLVGSDGRPVDAAAWPARRREILDLFADNVYGRTPSAAVDAAPTVLSTEPSPFAGATRSRVSIAFAGPHGRASMEVLLDLPDSVGPVPVFVGLNFRGNQHVDGDSRWPVGSLVGRGYGSATVYCGDLFPDRVDGRPDSVAALFEDQSAADSWGAIGCWAWGLSRVADYLLTLPQVDAGRLIVHGHSRLGKAGLWAAAQDQRFAMAVSNESGCGGASLARRNFGETVGLINERFPHWFSGAYKRYNGAESELPVDQHMLLALVAPRPLAVASAVEDRWSDPRGEFLGAVHASPVYELLGVEGLAVRELPPVDQPVSSRVGYHIRSGGHDITNYDWQQFMHLADRHLG
jgi:hypothetical protein